MCCGLICKLTNKRVQKCLLACSCGLTKSGMLSLNIRFPFVVAFLSCFNMGTSPKFCLCCQLPELRLGKKIEKWEWNKFTSLHQRYTFKRGLVCWEICFCLFWFELLIFCCCLVSKVICCS